MPGVSAGRSCASAAWWTAAIGSICIARSAIAQATPETCLARESAVRLDHVVVAVDDLERASGVWRNLGFRLKPGREHPNGIRNAHAKFPDGTELELLTVEEPSDELADWYHGFISGGGGGAFLSLSAGAVGDVARALGRAGLEATITRGSAFDYASFPPGHPLRQVFFIDYRDPVRDAPDVTEHSNGASGLREVGLEGPEGSRLPAALLELGGRSCGVMRHTAGFEGAVFGLANGRVILMTGGESGVYPRVRAVTLLSPGMEGDRLIPPGDAEGVWIRLAPEERRVYPSPASSLRNSATFARSSSGSSG